PAGRPRRVLRAGAVRDPDDPATRPHRTECRGPGRDVGDEGHAGRGVSVQRPTEGTEDARGARPPPEGFEAEDLRGRTGRRNVRGRGSGKADRDVAGAVPRSSSGPGIPPTSLEERPDDLRRLLSTNPVDRKSTR